MTPHAPHALTDFVRAHTHIHVHPLVPELPLHLARALLPIWEASEREGAPNAEPPYWAFVWPGGALTARFILDRPGWVAGRRVLALAAGSGVAAIAAARAGAAAVTASEIDPRARAALALNAALNGVALHVSDGDPLAAPPPGDALILAGDVCYQRDMAERMLAWLRRARLAGAEVWLADPGRAYLPRAGLEELARAHVPTLRELEDRDARETTLYRLLS